MTSIFKFTLIAAFSYAIILCPLITAYGWSSTPIARQSNNVATYSTSQISVASAAGNGWVQGIEISSAGVGNWTIYYKNSYGTWPQYNQTTKQAMRYLKGMNPL